MRYGEHYFVSLTFVMGKVSLQIIMRMNDIVRLCCGPLVYHGLQPNISIVFFFSVFINCISIIEVYIGAILLILEVLH